MFSWLLRLILLLIVLRLMFQFVRGLLVGMAGPRAPRGARAGGQSSAVPLVKDPVCGTYVVRSKALAAAAGSETAWFCSEQCRDAWRASHAGSRIA
jgi:YHS domain-containing protein